MGADIRETDEVWARPQGVDLLVRLYREAGREGERLPVVISVHGGAWNHFDRTAGALYQRALAQAGNLVVAIDFRQGPAHQHPAASADIAAAVRWVRCNAVRLNADVTCIGLLGSSSGGHLALFAGTQPNVDMHQGTPLAIDGAFVPRDDVDASVSYLVALWPVSDPYLRYRYAKRAGIERLREAHERFFADEAAMQAASVPRLVTAGEATHLPPLLVVHPGEDGNVPLEITFDLLRAWQYRRGYVEYAHFPGEPHAFGYRPSAASTRLQALIIDFCARMRALGT